jgi:hypothetical protein
MYFVPPVTRWDCLFAGEVQHNFDQADFSVQGFIILQNWEF